METRMENWSIGTPGPLTMLDSTVALVLLVAMVRGLTIGLVREGFSIAALGVALLAIHFGAAPLAGWLTNTSGGEISSVAAPWVAKPVIGIATLVLMGMAGRIARRSVRYAGLGLADRLGGGALGAAEGALVAMLVIMGFSAAVGPSHPIMTQSRSPDAFDAVRSYVARGSDVLPDVAAPSSRD